MIQETEEALEEMKQQLAHTMERMNAETDTLKKQIEHLNICIAEEEDKARDLELRARMFQLGDSMKEEDQEKLLLDLNKKVETVYRNCIGEHPLRTRHDIIHKYSTVIKKSSPITFSAN